MNGHLKELKPNETLERSEKPLKKAPVDSALVLSSL